MNIEVNDSYTLYLISMLVHQVSCRYCYVVYIAKPICLLLVTHVILECFPEYSSMMTRWSYGTEGICKLS